VAAGDYSVLTKKQRKIADKLLNRLPVKTKVLRKNLGKELIIVLRRIPKELLPFLKEDSSSKKVLTTWFHKVSKPSSGWPKFKKPFPTTRQEKVLLNRLGNFPKTFPSTSHGEHLVSPCRSSLYYTETQFWLWYEWQSLKNLMACQVEWPHIPFIKELRKLLFILPKSLDHMDIEQRECSWSKSTRADIFVLLRVSRRSQKI